jgi:hypothetical protein
MGLAAQGNQNGREASDTDGNLRKRQQGIGNVDDEHSRRLRVNSKGWTTACHWSW